MARNILLVDPERLIQNLLARALLQDKEFDQVFEADSYADAVQIMSRESISVVLTEIVIRGASGFDLVRKISSDYACHSIVLTGLAAEELEQKSFSAGAFAVVLKSSSFQSLLAVLHQAKGTPPRTRFPIDQHRPESITATKEDGNDSSIANAHNGSTDPLNALTPREKEVFHLLTVGMKNVEIARQLYISTRTVETHRARLSKKLKVNSSIDLLRYAMKHGLTQL